jgi:hypothetical protein
MIKSKGNKKESILNNTTNLDKKPAVVSIIKSKDAKLDDVFEIEIACKINSDLYLQNNIKDINVSISNNSFNEIKNKSIKSSLDVEIEKIEKTKNLYKDNDDFSESELQIKNEESFLKSRNRNKLINKSIENLNRNNKSINTSNLVGQKIGKINFAPATNKLNVLSNKKTQKEIYKEPKQLKINLNKNTVSETADKNIEAPSTFRDLFKKKYNKNNISSNKDMASLFQDSHNKTSFKKKNAGIIPSKSRNRDLDTNLFDLVFSGIKKEIIDKSDKNNITVSKSSNVATVKEVKTKVFISRKKLLDMKTNSNIIFNVNTKNNVVQNVSKKIRIDEILQQEKLENTDFSLGVKRSSKASNLLVGKSKKEDSSLTIFTKKVNQASLPDREKFKKKDDIKIDKTNRLKVKGKAKKTQDVFYRGTLNFNNENYSNLKCIVDRSNKRFMQNEPFANIIAELDLSKDAIKINVTDISNNVRSIRVFKQIYSGNIFKKEKIPLLDEKGEEVSFKILQEEKSLEFIDYDVFDERAYRYCFECIMNNGELKKGFNTFLEKYEEKSEIIKFTNVESELTSKGINVSFKVEKLQEDVDVILDNLFGNLFDLFEDELSKIKDLTGLVYSIEVVRINGNNSSAKTIARVTVDKEGFGSFFDNAPNQKGIFYKLIPRVVPAADIISKVNDKISLVGKNQVFKKLNNVYAAKRKSREAFLKSKTSDSNDVNQTAPIISSIGNKFSNRLSFTKGRIVTPENEVEESGFNFFKFSSTGDIAYYNFNSQVGNKLDFVISKAVISEIPHHKSKEKISDAKKMQKQFFSFNIGIAGDENVDFYKFYVKENDDVYLDGIFNSTDDSGQKNYKYLIEQEGSFGKVDYFVVPVFKDGLIGNVKNVGTKIIQ